MKMNNTNKNPPSFESGFCLAPPAGLEPALANALCDILFILANAWLNAEFASQTSLTATSCKIIMPRRFKPNKN